MFRFAEPQWLYALTAIPLILLVFWLSQRAKTRRLARFGNCSTLAALMPDRSPLREWIKTGVLCAALGLVIVAAARPQVGSRLREVEVEGREMMFVVDVSNSMSADDVKPSRIERTKHAIGQLLERLADDRIRRRSSGAAADNLRLQNGAIFRQAHIALYDRRSGHRHRCGIGVGAAVVFERYAPQRLARDNTYNRRRDPR